MEGTTPALALAQTEARAQRWRRIPRLLFAPFAYLVFIPFLGVWTFLCATLAVLTAYVSRRVAGWVGSAWALVLLLINFTWVTVEGRRHMKRGQSYIIMANHQSHFDVLAILGWLGRQVRFVEKIELRRVPVFGLGCEKMGQVFVDRKNRDAAIESLRAAAPGLLRHGYSVLFFGEGTRSPDGRMREFKKGGFMMALELGFPILPLSISGSRYVLPARSFRLLPGRIRMRIHAPILPAAYTVEERERLVADVRRAIASGLTEWEAGEIPKEQGE